MECNLTSLVLSLTCHEKNQSLKNCITSPETRSALIKLTGCFHWLAVDAGMYEEHFISPSVSQVKVWWLLQKASDILQIFIGMVWYDLRLGENVTRLNTSGVNHWCAVYFLCLQSRGHTQMLEGASASASWVCPIVGREQNPCYSVLHWK